MLQSYLFYIVMALKSLFWSRIMWHIIDIISLDWRTLHHIDYCGDVVMSPAPRAVSRVCVCARIYPVVVTQK